MSVAGPRRRGFIESLGQGLNRTRPGGGIEGNTQAIARLGEAIRSQQSRRTVTARGAFLPIEGLSSGTTSETSHTFTIGGIPAGWLVVASAQVEADPPGPALATVGLGGSSPEVSGINGVTSFTVSDDDLLVVVANEDGSSRTFRLDVYARPI